MSDEIERRLADVERRQVEFREEMQAIKGEVETIAAAQYVTGERVGDIHGLFFKASLTGRPPLAKQIQELLTVYTSTKQSARFVLWVFGFIAACGAAWAAVRGWWPGDK